MLAQKRPVGGFLADFFGQDVRGSGQRLLGCPNSFLRCNVGGCGSGKIHLGPVGDIHRTEEFRQRLQPPLARERCPGSLLGLEREVEILQRSLGLHGRDLLPELVGEFSLLLLPPSTQRLSSPRARVRRHTGPRAS